MMAAINKVFKSAGLDTLLINAGVLAGDASAASALEGKNYNRGIRALKIVYEVIRANEVSLYQNDAGSAKWGEFEKVVPDIISGGEGGREAIHGTAMRELTEQFLLWKKKKSSQCGRCAIVSLLLEMIEALLAYIRASRSIRSAKDADGKHVGFANYFIAMEALQPWIAASDRLLYMRVLEAQRRIFLSIEERFGPEVMQALRSGAVLGIQRNAEQFAAVWNDLHLEQTTNAESKRLLTTTATRHASVRARITAMPSTARTSKAFNAMVPPGLRSTRTSSKKKEKPPMQRAPKRMIIDRSKLSEALESLDVVCDCNPLVQERRGDLNVMRHFTSGTTVCQAVVDDLSSVKEIGGKKVAEFAKRFPDGHDGKYMWDPLKKTQLKNFQYNDKLLQQNSQRPERTLQSCLFELTALNDKRPPADRIPVWREEGECLAKYEFGDRARAFFHSNGKKRSGTKASLAPALAGNRPATLAYNNGSPAAKKSTAIAFDFMAYVQMGASKVDASQHKFLEDLLLISVKRTLSDVVSQQANTAYIVCDPYPDAGVPKDCESDARAESGVIMFDKIFGSKENYPTPMLPPLQRRKFLRLAQNKRLLLELLGGIITRVLNSGKYIGVTTVFLTGAGGTMRASRFERVVLPTAATDGSPSVTVTETGVPWLESSCPEADQTLLVAVRHWVSEMGGKEMVVASWDTDVFVSLVGLADKLVAGGDPKCKLAVLRGVGARRQRVDVWAARKRLAELPAVGGTANAKLLLAAIIALHNVTGSDGVPFPYHQGKKKAFAAFLKMLNLKGGPDALKAMAKTGVGGVMSRATRQSFTMLYLLMYGMYGKAKNLDHARGLLWTDLKCDEARFPPTESSLDLQVARTSTQCRITLMSVGDYKAAMPEPEGYDKLESNGKIKWKIKEREAGTYYAPLVLLQMLPCNCNSSRQKAENQHFCRSSKCTCFERAIPCSELCVCRGGKNVECRSSPNILHRISYQKRISLDNTHL